MHAHTRTQNFVIPTIMTSSKQAYFYRLLCTSPATCGPPGWTVTLAVNFRVETRRLARSTKYAPAATTTTTKALPAVAPIMIVLDDDEDESSDDEEPLDDDFKNVRKEMTFESSTVLEWPDPYVVSSYVNEVHEAPYSLDVE